MRETLEEKISNASSLTDVLLILQEKIKIDIHVATLAYVEEIYSEYTSDSKFGIINCKPFPLKDKQEEYIIQAYYFTEKGNELTKGQIICILFTDLNFINNLKSIQNIPKSTQDTNIHSLKYGVILNLM